VICCYIAISTLLQTKDEFRFIIPYVEFSKQLKGAKPLVLDTSVIIDGRIADICDTGVIDTKMIVPRFVLQELQGIADSSDKIKRNRGRRGLDILKKMQSNPKVELQMHEGNLAELRDVQKVDERLVVLAKVLGARVVTNDFNLNKISQLQGVDVINLNELSNALKLVALPGENLTIRIVKQAAEGIPEGPIVGKVPRLIKPPAGETYHAIESPKGELGYFIVSDGKSTNPYRFRVRPPSFCNLQGLRRLVRGHLVADVVALIGSIDIVLGEVDR